MLSHPLVPFPPQGQVSTSRCSHLQQLLGVKLGEVAADVLSDRLEKLLVIVVHTVTEGGVVRPTSHVPPHSIQPRNPGSIPCSRVQAGDQVGDLHGAEGCGLGFSGVAQLLEAWEKACVKSGVHG